MSLPEVLLWQRLRDSDTKFRRQHPIGPYIVDFYCAAAKLVIEVDGQAHNAGDRPGRDARRDMSIQAAGLRLIRIPAADVLADPDAVADALTRAALPLHRPSGGPSPHALHGKNLVFGAA